MRILPPTTVVFGLALAAFGAWAAPAFAADFASTNFISRSPTVNTSGGTATSTSFSTVTATGQTATGISTSTSFQVRAGSLYFDSFSPQAQNWRWYSDTTNETPTTALAAENVAPSSVADGTPLKLRWTLHDVSGIGATGVKFMLQFSTSADFANATDVAEQSACNSTSEWCYANGGGTDNGVITTGLLSDSDSCASGVGQGCGTHNESGTSTSTFTQAANAATEYEFTIQESGATPATVYFFRAILTTSTTSVPLATGASYPSVSTSGGTLSFSIGGLPLATTTSGVTTSASTTSTSVPFGQLAFTGSSIAANRLTVSTNASSGYEIYAYQRQDLLNQSSVQIPPVSGTNASPLSWTTGCSSSSTGCWGYHTDASVLAGGSTRFAANDTYAQFTTTPSEVAYSATPVTSQSTDMVYRLAVDNQQEPGTYSTELVYIVTPTF